MVVSIRKIELRSLMEFGHLSDMVVDLLVTGRQFAMNRASQSLGSDWFLTGGPEVANAAVSARCL